MNDKGQPPQLSQDSASLVKRLAGPSTTKAGLANDQTEINRIIAEASKGSKFYENEKRKDKDLTERISKILKQRDECMKDVDIRRIESTVDNLLVELEAQRDLSQIIVHVDMDAFFANVELLYNPDLKGKPFGVGYGVLTTASYEARKFGVRSGMAGFIAKKLCPDLMFVPINGPRYSEMSGKVMDIFRRYDPNMCPAGVDEGYLNITAYCKEHAITPDECVHEMRSKVYDETKLTVSAGIAPNKMLAKICSDKNKPNGQFHLPFNRQAIVSFMQHLSIRKIPGIGRVNERLLESIGINSCGDIYTHRAILFVMDKQFGLHFLLRTYLGIASNSVQPMQRHERKGIGVERTFNPLGDKEKILQKLEDVAAELEKDMEKTGWTGRTVTLKYKLDTYQRFTRTKSLHRWVTKKEDLFAIGKELLQAELPLKVRLVGLRVTKLKDLRRTESSSDGIRKFFEPIDSDKKRKLGLERPDEEMSDEDADPDAMPGFHEFDEADAELSQETPDEVDEMIGVRPESELIDGTKTAGPSKPRPPVSAPARIRSPDVRTHIVKNAGHDDNTLPSTSALPAPPTGGKPLSTNSMVRQKRSVSEDGPETHVCPVCGKTLEMDNDGLNAHVDFCLSRAAILEAQGQAGCPSNRASGAGGSASGNAFPWAKREGGGGKRRRG